MTNKTDNGKTNDSRRMACGRPEYISRKNGDAAEALPWSTNSAMRYGKEAYLTIHLGKVHEYTGMKLDRRERGKVKNRHDGLPEKNTRRPDIQVSRRGHRTGGKPSLLVQ